MRTTCASGLCILSSLIRYAGWIGTVAARYATPGQGNQLSSKPTLDESKTRLAAVAGTSTCHLIQAPEGKFVPGVWGPYKNALFPGWWMNEGGQSSTGQLIDYIISTHPAYSELQTVAKKEEKSIHTVLAGVLDRLLSEAGTTSLTRLTKDLHLYPDLHGEKRAFIRFIEFLIVQVIDHHSPTRP